MVEFDSDPCSVLYELLHGYEVVVPVPVSVGEVVAEGAPPGLPRIDVGRDRGLILLRDHQAVVAAEGAVEEVAEIVDVVIRGEQACIDLLLCHVGAQGREPAIHFLRGECRPDLLAVPDRLELFHEFHLDSDADRVARRAAPSMLQHALRHITQISHFSHSQRNFRHRYGCNASRLYVHLAALDEALGMIRAAYELQAALPFFDGIRIRPLYCSIQ